MTTIEIVPLPGDPGAYRFAFVIEHDNATELEVAQWARFGEGCGAVSTMVGESPIVVIDRTHPFPLLPVPPGPCPSILNISPFTSGPICCELLATHLGRHTDGKTIWGEVEPYETPAGAVGIIDRGEGTVAQTSAVFSEEALQQPLVDPPGSHVHRWMPQTTSVGGTFYYCAWTAADGSAVCTAVTPYPASVPPYGVNVPAPRSLHHQLAEESSRWDRHDGGTDLLTDMGSAVNAYRYAERLGPASRIEVALPTGRYGEVRECVAYRLGRRPDTLPNISHWLGMRGVTLHLVSDVWTEPTQFLVYQQGSFVTEPDRKIDLAPLVESLSADVNDEPSDATFEAHIHVWENAGGDNETGDVYRCTYVWRQGDSCDSLFYTNGMILIPPMGQLCRRVTSPDGTSKTETLS